MSGSIPYTNEQLLTRIDYLEENRRFVQNVLEMALSLVDFQENILNSYGPETILEETEKRIRYLIPFDANALYIVNQDSGDFQLAVCNPPEMRAVLAADVEDVIEKGFFAWAIRERRGISVASRDRSKRLVLHVIATHSRVRGMFVGQMDNTRQQIPDTALTLLSIILLNTANALESLEFYRMLRHQKTTLERQVEERTQALAESERQMQQVLKLQAIGTLAGGIAHDFNNILFPIIGYTEISMDDVAEDSPIRRNLEEILKAANRARELVQQILTFSRQNGRERKPIRVQVIVKEALRLLRASIPKTIDIHVDIEDRCNAIMGDPTQIHQVIMNLCTNAYQAMQETGGTLEVRLVETHIGYEETVKRIGIKMGPHLHLTVKDEGVGMEPSVLHRIFEPYYTTKEPGKGTGLGLSVIHGIVKNHGGFITVESTPGKGSTFHVYLPTLEDVEAEIEEAASAAKSGGSERILLVDDEMQIVDMEKHMLEKLGYRVTTRTSSLEALETFVGQPDQFDLVITDMTMPHMSGDHLARRIWDIRPGIPVILCTGYNEMMSEDKAMAMGIRKFILKPIDKDELAVAIRSALNSSPTPYLVPRREPAPPASPMA
ncbi:MAG: response regulator [Desulfobacterales bacterium]|jgi:signal transduction histidine kinase/ActR/RegA family two-component response regulator|nr:response regulator [Desulfobacterales bacterium]